MSSATTYMTIDEPVQPDYRSMPTNALIEKIGYLGSQGALHELHQNRRLFRIRHGSPLLLAEFVRTLLYEESTVRLFGRDAVTLDTAYDLTIDKFTILAGDTASHDQKPSGRVVPNRKRTDCRHYFRAIANAIARWLSLHPEADALAIEVASAQILQRRVACNCWWSCQEARRQHRWGWSRFAWCRPEGSVTVWMPRRVPGRQRRTWLEANVPSPDLVRAGEALRIQGIIDRHFGSIEVVQLRDDSHARPEDDELPPAVDHLVEYQAVEHGLSELVAAEKAMRIHEQRPAVRRLGKKRLKALIIRVIDEITQGRLDDHVVAAAFGMSRATFSRFAGSRWLPGSDRHIPDLYLNLARVIASSPTFRQVATETGLLSQIEAVAQGRSR